MSDVQALSASIGADVAQFLTAMQQSAQMVQQLAQAQIQAQQASAAQSAGAQAAAAAAKQAAEINRDWSEALKENVAIQREAAAATREAATQAKEAAKASKEAADQQKESIQKLADLAGVAIGIEAIKKGVEVLKDFAVECINAAAAAQMTGVQFRAAFGASSKEVEEWAESTGSAFGRSSDDMMKAATSFKVVATGMGIGGEAAESMAEGLTKMATEMSIARGIPLDQAVQSIDQGLHGAGKSLASFGIILSTTTQDMEAAREGLGETYAQLTEAQKAQVNFNLMMAGESKLANDAAEASGTLANQIASLKSIWEETTAHLGASHLPMLTSIVGTTKDLVGWFDKLGDSAKEWTIALSFGPLGSQLKAAGDAIKRLSALVGIGGGEQLPTAEYRDTGGASATDMAAAASAYAKHDQAAIAVADKQDEERAKARAAREAALAADRLKDLKSYFEEWKAQGELAIRQQADYEAAQREADQEHIEAAKSAVEDATKNLNLLKNNGSPIGDIQAAQVAVQSAYGLVEGATQQAMSDMQAQIAANNTQILADQANNADAKDVERLKQDNLELAKKITADQRELASAQRDAYAAQVKSFEAEAATRRAAVSGAIGALGGSGLSGVVGSAQAGAAAAGPAGAMAGAVVGLLEMSQQAKDFSAAVQSLVQEMADSVGRVLEPLIPIMRAMGSEEGPLWKGLGDALAEVMQIVAEVLIPVMQALAPLFKVLGLLMEGVAVVLKGVAFVIRGVIDGIAAIWNGILSVIASVFDALAHALPGGLGDKMRDFYNSVESMKIDTTGLDNAMQNASNGITSAGGELSDTLAKLTQAAHDGTLSQVALTSAQRAEIQTQIAALQSMAATDAANGWTSAAQMASSAAQQLANDLAAAGNAAAPGIAAAFNKVIQDVQKVGADRARLTGDQQAINDFAKAGNGAAESAAVAQYQKDLQQIILDGLQQALDTATAQYQAGSGSQQAVLDAQQALTEAQIQASVSNTSSTTANTHATQALTAALTNTPTGFRASYYDSGANGGGAMLGGKTGGLVFTGNITIVSNDPAAFEKGLRKHVAKKRVGAGGIFGS